MSFHSTVDITEKSQDERLQSDDAPFSPIQPKRGKTGTREQRKGAWGTSTTRDGKQEAKGEQQLLGQRRHSESTELQEGHFNIFSCMGFCLSLPFFFHSCQKGLAQMEALFVLNHTFWFYLPGLLISQFS